MQVGEDELPFQSAVSKQLSGVFWPLVLPDDRKVNSTKSPERIQLGQTGVLGIVPVVLGQDFLPKKKKKSRQAHTTSWWLNQPI